MHDAGEFGLIDRIARALGPPSADVVAGIGDDAAVLQLDGQRYLLATVDMLVEGVHFVPDSSPVLLGRRALAVNFSDIAAMGGQPHSVLTSLALPPTTSEAWVSDLYAGMRLEATEFQANVVGGNLARTPGPICIDVTVLGTVDRQQLVLRTGARVGDVIGVTGVLGAEAARRALSNEGMSEELWVPHPRVQAAQRMAATGHMHAMIDISDGLGADLGHLTSASGVGAVIYAEQVPVSVSARQVGQNLGEDPLPLALFGGEDYELLFTAGEENWEALVNAAGPVPLSQVGTILPAEHGVMLEGIGGGREPLPPRGWTHF